MNMFQLILLLEDKRQTLQLPSGGIHHTMLTRDHTGQAGRLRVSEVGTQGCATTPHSCETPLMATLANFPGIRSSLKLTHSAHLPILCPSEESAQTIFSGSLPTFIIGCHLSSMEIFQQLSCTSHST